MTPPPESTPPATVAPVAWAVVDALGHVYGPSKIYASCEAEALRLNTGEATSHVVQRRPYRIAPLYAADVPALMARIERAEGRADRMVETLRDVVRPYIVARGTDPIFWGANVLSMIDDIISRAAEGA